MFTDLLETLEEEVLGPQLVEPDGVDDEDGVVEDVLEAGEGNQHLPVQNWNKAPLQIFSSAYLFPNLPHPYCNSSKVYILVPYTPKVVFSLTIY